MITLKQVSSFAYKQGGLLCTDVVQRIFHSQVEFKADNSGLDLRCYDWHILVPEADGLYQSSAGGRPSQEGHTDANAQRSHVCSTAKR